MYVERGSARLKLLFFVGCFIVVPVLFLSIVLVWFTVCLSVYIACSRPERLEAPREARPENSICYELFDFNLGFLS